MARRGAKQIVRVHGLDKVRRKFNKLGKQGKAAYRGAMYLEGLFVIGKAVKMAPAVTGRLRNSHFVTWPSLLGTVKLGFGVVYAASVEAGIRVIEMKRSRQKAAFASMRETGWKKSKTGGPGFMRNALEQARGRMAARIAERAKRLFDRGQGFAPNSKVPKSASAGRAKGAKG